MAAIIAFKALDLVGDLDTPLAPVVEATLANDWDASLSALVVWAGFFSISASAATAFALLGDTASDSSSFMVDDMMTKAAAVAVAVAASQAPTSSALFTLRFRLNEVVLLSRMVGSFSSDLDVSADELSKSAGSFSPNDSFWFDFKLKNNNYYNLILFL